MAVKLSIKKLLNKKHFKLNKKVILKNKFKLALLVFIICVFLIPKMLVPKCLISFMKSLLGKIVCVVVILYIGYKDITYGLMLTVLFGALLYVSNNYILENMEMQAHNKWHDRNMGDIPNEEEKKMSPPLEMDKPEVEITPSFASRDASASPMPPPPGPTPDRSTPGPKESSESQMTTQMSVEMNPTQGDGFANMEPFYGDVENYQSV